MGKGIKRFYFKPQPISRSLVYSTKKALLVGINYTGTSGQLRGCINDVKNIQRYLLSVNYLPQNIVIMTDQTTGLLPTRENILQEFKKLVGSGADHLVFHYSGHGSQTRDTNNDEDDARDETILPIDYKQKGCITDDELYDLICNNIKPNSKLFCIMDCCHSGTSLDLKYGYNDLKDSIEIVSPTSKELNVVCISGCLDHQYSADAYEEQESQGALTYSLCKALKASEQYSLKELLKTIKFTLKNKYEQIPYLTLGQELNMDSSYTILF